MSVQAQALLTQIRNPELWGTGYNLEATNAIAIWEWAEASSQIDIQAEIAGVVAAQYLSHHRNTDALEKKFKELASEAQASARWKNYVGFLEGLSALAEANWEQRQRIEEEICRVYARLADAKRHVWHLDRLAAIYIRLKAFGQAKQVLVHSYHISHELHYSKGIGHALLSIGLLLEAQGKPIDACRFLYRAKGIFDSTHSRFYITARDILNGIAEECKINKTEYETTDTVEMLIDGFTKA
jgi:hypothetical protein